jgi:4-amino-4-deoxy-L-arabinose transferase-like glycosyltransferase
MIRRMEWTVITVILAAYLVLAGQYVWRTPDWQTPDEPAHYNYVRQIVDEGRLPVLKTGDWNQAYQDALTAHNFAPQWTACPQLTDYIGPPPEGFNCPGLETVEYEDHQPPLYYLLQAPVYALSDGDLVTMRLFSALLGAGVVLATWAALRSLAPGRPCIPLTAAAFVAFIPQHLAILASVSNDGLTELIVALTLLATVRYLGNPDSAARSMSPLVLGVLAGAAMLTKTTIYFLGGIVVLAVLLRWRRARQQGEGWSWRRTAAHLSAVLIPALAIGGVWWVRNLAVYGGTDFTALSRHESVTIGQPRTADYIDDVYGGSTRVYLENYAKTTFHSFWGQFGWMALPMPANVYRLLLLFTLGSLAGVVVWLARVRGRPALTPAQWDAVLILAAVIVLVFAAYLIYNLEFVQFQGRYLYPALLPLALIVAVGLAGWVGLVEDRFPALSWLPVTAMSGLAVFAWYALDTYLVPNLPVW